MKTTSLWNQTRCLPVATCELATSSWTRAKGLLGRSSLDGGAGLWIKPSSGVHTFAMRFALDVVALDKRGKVLGLRQNLRPNRIAWFGWRTRSVVELPLGTVESAGIRVGDTLGNAPA